MDDTDIRTIKFSPETSQHRTVYGSSTYSRTFHKLWRLYVLKWTVMARDKALCSK